MFPMLTLLVTGMAIVVVAVVAALTEEGEKNAAAWRARMEREQAERERDIAKTKTEYMVGADRAVLTIEPTDPLLHDYILFDGTWEEWEAKLEEYLADQRKRLEGK